MRRLLLVTCDEHPEGEPRGELVVEELAARGVAASWVSWDDPAVDWSAAELVAVRSTWDYERRRPEFLEWARRVERRTRLVNPAHVLAWNTDKRYLLQLIEAGLPVVPTLAAEEEGELPAAIAEFDCAVLKPAVGAGGRGVVVFDGTDGGPDDLDESRLGPGPWIVQPLVESVRTEGETSVFVLGGRAVSQVRKRPGAAEIRVHEEYGGRTEAVALQEEAATLAVRTVESVQEMLGAVLAYARVDQMRLGDGTLVVSEVEVTEPGLYLEHVPQNAAFLADALTRV